MTTQEVANRLVELCREGDYETVYRELYSPNAVSVEPQGAPLERAEGMEQIKAKGERWNEMVETVNSSEVSDPIVAENYFTCTMKMNVTFKGAPAPTNMEEVVVYNVKEGKVVQEQFFYTPAPAPQA